MVLIKTVESDYTDSIDGRENEDLTFLTFANLKIGVSVHFFEGGSYKSTRHMQ